MKINIHTIPEEGLKLTIDRDGEWFRKLRPEEDGFLLHRLDLDCVVRKIAANVYIEGTIEAKAEIPCSRCLEMTTLLIKSPFSTVFSPAPVEMADETELSAADLDFEYYEGETIDLDEVVFEQIMLQIPMKPLCFETCLGLCPHCGANLNHTTCNCRTEETDQRFVLLKQLKIQH